MDEPLLVEHHRWLLGVPRRGRPVLVVPLIKSEAIDTIMDGVRPENPEYGWVIRDMLLVLIVAHNELEERVKRIEQREPE